MMVALTLYDLSTQTLKESLALLSQLGIFHIEFEFELSC